MVHSNKIYKNDIQKLLNGDRDAKGRLFNKMHIIPQDETDDFYDNEFTRIDILEHWFDGNYILEIGYTRDINSSQWNSKQNRSLQQFLDLPDSGHTFVWSLYDKSDIHNPILKRTVPNTILLTIV